MPGVREVLTGEPFAVRKAAVKRAACVGAGPLALAFGVYRVARMNRRVPGVKRGR